MNETFYQIYLFKDKKELCIGYFNTVEEGLSFYNEKMEVLENAFDHAPLNLNSNKFYIQRDENKRFAMCLSKPSDSHANSSKQMNALLKEGYSVQYGSKLKDKYCNFTNKTFVYIKEIVYDTKVKDIISYSDSDCITKKQVLDYAKQHPKHNSTVAHELDRIEAQYSNQIKTVQHGMTNGFTNMYSNTIIIIVAIICSLLGNIFIGIVVFVFGCILNLLNPSVLMNDAKVYYDKEYENIIEPTNLAKDYYEMYYWNNINGAFYRHKNSCQPGELIYLDSYSYNVNYFSVSIAQYVSLIIKYNIAAKMLIVSNKGIGFRYLHNGKEYYVICKEDIKYIQSNFAKIEV